MGLERLACMMQGVDNLFEVDTITDHIRSSVFMIGDGVIPSNSGRGYVLRRLIRRACRHGRLLGVNEPFLYKVVDTVVDENLTAYDYLDSKRELISKVMLSEEESFGKTIDSGLALLEEYINKMDGKVFSGEDAFKLNDTYGFPLDLTRDILEEKGLTVDEDQFNALLEKQKRTARAARKDSDTDAWISENVKIEANETEFVGYTDYECNSKVLAVISDGEIKDMLGAGEEGIIVLDKTPFYAESGGQVGDSGVISSENGTFLVADTTKNADKIYLHTGKIDRGVICVGDTVKASINAELRDMTKRNHTAAHLLQAALREVLGNHVEQAGQLEMPIEEAKKMGAMMLFGEKYGDIVRVVKAGDFSTEFCGGTHVTNSGQIGLFKITSESSVAAGVRRITALTGSNLIVNYTANEKLIKLSAAALKTGISDVKEKIDSIVAENKAKDKEIQALNAELTKLKSADMFSKPVDVCGLDVYVAKLDGTTPDALRSMGDDLKGKGDNVVGVIAGVNGEKATIVAVCGKEAISKGVKAGDVVREVAKLAGGGGGGRPDSAMAGAKDLSKLDDAMNAVCDIIKSFVQ